jgi:hypothetical protein
VAAGSADDALQLVREPLADCAVNCGTEGVACRVVVPGQQLDVRSGHLFDDKPLRRDHSFWQGPVFREQDRGVSPAGGYEAAQLHFVYGERVEQAAVVDSFEKLMLFAERLVE